jgi:hypothetical protein
MQKKLIALSVVLFLALNSSVVYSTEGFNGIKTAVILGGLGSITAAGARAAKMNEEYSKKKKAPDFNMRATKAIGAACILVGADLVLGDTSNTPRNLAKLGAFSVSLLAVTDTAANIVREIPIIGGLLTDPVDEKGKEIRDSGAYARGLLVYVPLRDFALSLCR